MKTEALDVIFEICIYIFVIVGLAFLYGDKVGQDGPQSKVKFIYQEF